MLSSWAIAAALTWGATNFVDALKVQLTPSNLTPLVAEGYELWSVPQEATSATAEYDGISLELSTSSDSLNGGRYKFLTAQVINPLGQWLIGEGISSSATDGNVAIQLSVSGLSEGSHSLLVYHNAWDALSAASNLDVSVDGNTIVVRFVLSVILGTRVND
jgi:hypothetical protein